MKAAIVLLALTLSACAPRLYRVCWVGPYTGDTYCGKPLPRKVAEAHAKQGNAEFPNLKHYVRRVR